MLVTDRVMVRDGVRQLPQQQAAAVVAAKMYGFTQHETSQMTGRHPGTFAVHVARAVARLALYLTPMCLIFLSIRSGDWSALGLGGVTLLLWHLSANTQYKAKITKPPEAALLIERQQKQQRELEEILLEKWLRPEADEGDARRV
ncbi:sigma factor-like helix-turn-helix DNA-binding protein [Streptomyces sp. NPDC019443]|uniref:sigma factor-like helix-turn-helix DNA-binding protein n=1 Tax=Streptomyces sp. NPDC019443 TaxID=3365061 RepID=UPI003790E273